MKSIVMLLMLCASLPAQAFDWSSLEGLLGKNPAAGASTPATGATLESLTQGEITSALKEALTRGTGQAIAQLGRENGFFNDAKRHIPLPDKLQTVSKYMRYAGMGKEADALELAMNRAAEAAVPQARDMLAKAVSELTLDDAKRILTDGGQAATDYFRRKTETDLTGKFLPVVEQATAQVRLAQLYNQYAGQAARLGLLKGEETNVDQYVTKRALDGLYKVIGEQEVALRNDPVGTGSALLKKVFEAVK